VCRAYRSTVAFGDEAERVGAGVDEASNVDMLEMVDRPENRKYRSALLIRPKISR